jgi:hypothetical protein
MICPSVKTSPFQWKCEARSIGAFTLREPTMNPSPASSRADRFDCAEHAGISGDHHRRIAEVMTIGEAGDDRDKRGGLGRVALKTANLQRESGAIHQEADDDLRIDAAFLRIMPTSA